MKKRTRIIAWIYLFIGIYEFEKYAALIYDISHKMQVLPWNLIAFILLNCIPWLFWVFMIIKKPWAWLPLATVYVLLCADWLINMVNNLFLGFPHPNGISAIDGELQIAGFRLITVVIPLLFLLTDRPSLWKTKSVENPSVEGGASETI